MPRYSELTQEQKDFIVNGCGGKGGFINPPEFIFHESCNQHDFYYWRGCNDKDRKIADKAFYKFMKECIAKEKWYVRAHYHIWAYTYYRGVRLSGGNFFYYGSKMKTLEDLEYDMYLTALKE